MRRALPATVLVLALALVAAQLVRAGLAGRVPDVEVRAIHMHHHAGRALPRHAPGQGFVCKSDGLHRIDVWVQAIVQPPEDDLVLTLHEDRPGGFLVRRAEADPRALRPRGGFLAFEFEPVSSSAGRTYWFQLESSRRASRSDCTVWVRQRGPVESDRPWGDRPVTDRVHRGELIPTHDGLSGLAFAAVHLDPSWGRPRLRLWPADDPPDDPAGVLRDARLSPSAPVEEGWVVFRFPPLEGGRRQRLAFQLEVPETTVLAATPAGLSFHTIYGPPAPSERLLGMSIEGGMPLDDRDLVFRAWTRSAEADAWTLVVERGGWSVLAGAALWIVATILILVLILAPGLRGASAPGSTE